MYYIYRRSTVDCIFGQLSKIYQYQRKCWPISNTNIQNRNAKGMSEVI